MTAVALAALLASGGAALALPSYNNIIVFGDSLSDIGNDCIAGFCTPSPPYAPGRFSNGPVAVELLAQKLGLPMSPALAGGNNFAFGGARVDNSVAPNIGIVPPTLQQQTQAYLGSTGGISDPHSLYVVFGGGNDVQAALENPASAGAILTAAYAGITNIITGLALTGAKHILLADVPNVGLTPYAAGLAITLGDPTIPAIATAESAQLNVALFGLYQQGRAAGFDISFLDAFGIETAAVANPAAYGLTNVTDPCFTGFSVCLNPNQYLFWDDLHPTARGHQLLADAAAAAIPEPTGIAFVGIGIAAVGWARRRGYAGVNSASISRR